MGVMSWYVLLGYSVFITAVAIIALFLYLRSYFSSKYGRARFALQAQLFAASALMFCLTSYFTDPMNTITTALHSVWSFIPVISFAITFWQLTTGVLVVFAFLIWCERIFNKWPPQADPPASDRVVAEKQIPFSAVFRIYFEDLKPASTTSYQHVKEPEATGVGKEEFLNRMDWPNSIKFLIAHQFQLVASELKYSALHHSFEDRIRHKEIFLMQTAEQATEQHQRHITSRIDQNSAISSDYRAEVVVRLGINLAHRVQGLPEPITELELFVPSVCMPHYLERLRTYLNKPLVPNGPDLKSTLVDIACESDNGKSVHDSIAQFLTSWFADSQGTASISLTGDYGQGKTTALIAASYALLGNSAPQGPIPIYIRLSGIDVVDRSTGGILGEWMFENNVSSEVLNYVLNSGRAVIIFDGFDEIDLRGRHDRVLGAFNKLYRLTEEYPIRLALAGRPKFFETIEERRNALREGAAGTVSVTLRYLKPPQAVLMFGKINPTSAPEFESRLSGADEVFLDLIRRPIILLQLALLWDVVRKELESNGNFTSVVIRKFIDSIFEREFLESEEKRRVAFLTEGEVRLLTGCVAERVGTKNSMSVVEFESLISSMLTEVDKKVSLAYRYNEIQESRSPMERAVGSDNWIRLSSRDFISRGIVERNIFDHTKIQFSHKSFGEYIRSELVVFRSFGYATNLTKCLYSSL